LCDTIWIGEGEQQADMIESIRFVRLLGLRRPRELLSPQVCRLSHAPAGSAIDYDTVQPIELSM
jgi:hypothetical protein